MGELNMTWRNPREELPEPNSRIWIGVKNYLYISSPMDIYCGETKEDTSLCYFLYGGKFDHKGYRFDSKIMLAWAYFDASDLPEWCR